jgi:glycosyltransferase involved in cell wall biosynthesis
MNHCTLKRDPEVSVVMSCYNASRWLHEAIDSVLAQTFEDFEFILVDDGSIDETWNIIQNYRDKDKRIVPISKKNTGLADSLNIGLGLAKGSWIARLDADDLCENIRLEKQISFVRNNPGVVLLGSGFVEIDEQSRAIKKHHYPIGHHNLVCHLERLQRFFPHSSAFYRVDMARHVGGYNLRIRKAEDCRLWLELAAQGRIACLHQPLVKIRKHSSQISHENNGRRQMFDAIAATACHFLRKAGAKDPSIDNSSEQWDVFLNWIEGRIDEAGIFENRKAWADARTEYFLSTNRLIGIILFGTRLLQSGHSFALIYEKIFGSQLPERLAREWIMISSLKPIKKVN